MTDTHPLFSSKNNTILIAFLIGMAFFTGYLFNKVKTLEQKRTVVADTVGNNTANQPKQNQQVPPQEENKDIKPKKPSSKDDHWRGDKNARYVWIEYSDLQCPFCQRIHPDLIKMMTEQKNKIAWVYYHYPLPGHQKAQKSAEATECAAEQKGNDGFWKMTDLIFNKMPSMELSQLPDLASNIGLNKKSFQSCLDSAKYAPKVKTQLDEGSQIGVRATPTNILYDMKTGKTKTIEGALPYESLQSALADFMK